MSTAFISHNKAFHFLTDKQLHEKVPSAFTKSIAKRASAEYIPIPTPKVLEDLAFHGWFPVDAYEVNPKKEENKGYQKHFIRLRNATVYVGKENEIEVIPELLVINSYDARCSYKVLMSLFRVLCGNGTLVCSGTLESMEIEHRGEKVDKKNELLHAIANNTKRAIHLMKEMKNTTLDHKKQKQFAQECCRARWDYTYKLHTPSELLTPVREEDSHTDLWTIFNVIQEKMMKGGWKGTGGRAVKPLKDPNRAVKVNSRLFEIAENFLHSIKTN